MLPVILIVVMGTAVWAYMFMFIGPLGVITGALLATSLHAGA